MRVSSSSSRPWSLHYPTVENPAILLKPEAFRIKDALDRGDDQYKQVLTEPEEQLLEDALREEDWGVYNAVVGLTACPEECEVAADGTCEHGYMSLALRANLLED